MNVTVEHTDYMGELVHDVLTDEEVTVIAEFVGVPEKKVRHLAALIGLKFASR